MAKKKNRITAAAAAASSSTGESTRQLKGLHSRLATEKAELQQLVELLSAKVAFIERNGAAIFAADPMMAETTADPAMTLEEAPVLQEEVKNLESEHSEVVFQQPEEDPMAEKASAEIGRELEDSVERKLMESAVEERNLGMEERLKKLEEAWERLERLFSSVVELEKYKWIMRTLAAILVAVGLAFVANAQEKFLI